MFYHVLGFSSHHENKFMKPLDSWRSIELHGREPLLSAISFRLSLPIKLLRLRDSSLLREQRGSSRA